MTIRTAARAAVLLAVAAIAASSAFGTNAAPSPADAPPADDPVFSAAGPASGFSLPASQRLAGVPTPEAFLGHRIGDAITTPERGADYVRALATTSPRLSVEKYGTTPEGRDLLLVAVSSPLNIQRLPEIRAAQRSVAKGKAAPGAAPPVVWIAGTVHGNEVAGSEAALALLYRLAASKEPAVEELLSRVVVLVDPCSNPDGKAKHEAWWRSVAGAEPDPDPDGLENNEPPFGSRGNHDGFDLNRDWAWATQPETRARLAAWLSWMPQVYVDLHEMGAESTYFFPPDGEPTHQTVAPSTRRWLETFGRAVASSFDARGWSYFVREQFDLFYPAYGDSWPTLHGAVGMTFEVAASGGLAYRREDGLVLTLKERALKHFTACFATLETAAARREELVRDWAEFLRETRTSRKVFVVPAGQDPGRLARLAELLRLQEVEVERTTRDLEGLGPPRPAKTLPAGSLVVDAAQPFGRYVEAIFSSETILSDEFVREERTRFLREERGRFYDVTAWGLPLAFGLESFAAAPSERSRLAGAREPWSDPAPVPARPAAGAPEPPRESPAYGWLLPGDDSASRLAAGRLLAGGTRVSLLTREAKRGGRVLAAGSFLVRRENNSPLVEEAVGKACSASGARPLPLAGAWTDSGPSLGSNSVVPLKKPKVVVLAGDGAVSPSSSGAVLHALRRDLGLSPLRRPASALGRMDLRDVTAIVVPAGSDRLKRDLAREENASALKRFVEAGGVVVGIRGGAEALREKGAGLSSVKAWEPPKEDKSDSKSDRAEKADKGDKAAKGAAGAGAKPPAPGEEADLVKDLERRPLSIPGAALRARTSLPNHPLLFGLGGRVPEFLVTDGRPPKRLAEAAANVVTVADENPLAAGFAWHEALDRWAGAPLVQVEDVGKGWVVSFAADPVFRATWPGSAIPFLNAVLLLP